MGSVLYRLIYSIWERKNPIINLKPSKLPLTTTRPLIIGMHLSPKLISSNTIDRNITDDQIEADNPEIIIGAFTLQQLAPVFRNNTEW